MMITAFFSDGRNVSNFLCTECAFEGYKLRVFIWDKMFISEFQWTILEFQYAWDLKFVLKIVNQFFSVEYLEISLTIRNQALLL